MRTFLLLAATVLLITTGCAQQSKLSGSQSVSKNSVAQKRKLILTPRSDATRQRSRETGDIWPLIEDGLWFAHDVPDHKVQRYLDWYAGNDSYFSRTLGRAEKYMPYVVEQLRNHDLPLELALLPFIESAYNPFAYSHSHAAGLWQFIPGTAREMGLRQDLWYEGRRDIIDSTDAAIRYLKVLNTMFDGDWLLTLAAYNGGPGTVRRAIEANQKQGKNTDFWSLKLRKETHNYVPRLVALAKVLSDPEQYAINRLSIPATAHFSVVDVKSQIDLAQAAKLADISSEDIHHLNPGFSRWVTPPNGPYRLLLPTDRVASFNDRLASAPRHSWQPGGEYVVRKGDTLGRIASSYGISLNDLSQLNQLKSSHLQIGQVLRLPVTAGATGKLAARSTAGSASAAPLHYQVKAGDSLWSIAQAHGTRINDLLAWNKLSRDAVISPGQQLQVKPSQARSEQNNEVSYQIQRGDSLYEIARRFRVEVNDILAWNDLDLQHMIRPGQSLTLFPSR